MDLLTADGWLPSYSIPAVLLQIKMAISNPDPKPARLAQNWEMQVLLLTSPLPSCTTTADVNTSPGRIVCERQ